MELEHPIVFLLKKIVRQQSEALQCDLSDSDFCLDCGKAGREHVAEKLPFCIDCYAVRFENLDYD